MAAAIASGACAWAARRGTGKDRLGWALMSISAGLWAAGEVAWSIYEVGLGMQVPYPSLADAGFLAAVPFAIAGIRAFWSDARGTSARWRVWFDGLIVALALTSTAWGFGLRTVWNSNSSTKLLDLAYPVADILIGTVLILAIRRATGQQKGRMALLLAGVACYSIADSAFAYLSAEGAFGAVGNDRHRMVCRLSDDRAGRHLSGGAGACRRQASPARPLAAGPPLDDAAHGRRR